MTRNLPWLILLALATSAGGQEAKEPSSLQILMAAEDLLSDVIARSEKSVVAIMRVRRSEVGEIPNFQMIDPFNRRFPRAQPDQDVMPDPDAVPTEFGTGVVIDAKGLVLTNYHVVRAEGQQHFVTTHERKTYRAKIKAADAKSDLAVLELEPHPQQTLKLTPIKFGDASTLRKGQIVLALGNPYGIARDGQVSASWGIVSNLARKAGPDPDETNPAGVKRSLHHYGTLIQTDAKLNFGTSGGALLNLRGEMVGLTTSLAAAAGYEQAAGYAIPVNETFLRILEALRSGREVDYGFLGVKMRNLEPRDMAGGKEGMRVDATVPGTPAHRHLQQDDIITHVNGKPIYDADGLVLNVSSRPADAPTRLTILRGNKSQHVEVDLAKSAPSRRVVTVPLELWRGMRVDFASAISQDFLMRNDNQHLLLEGGVAVAQVEQDTPAWRAGMRPEMIISHVGNRRVTTPREFREAVAGKSGTVPLREARMSTSQFERPIDRPIHMIDPE